MLVLTRKPGEQIIIGNNIRIKVVGISGNQVRLGIEAPGEIKVMRQELLARDERASENPPLTQRQQATRRPLAVADAR